MLLRIATHSIQTTFAASNPFSVSQALRSPNSRGFGKHCFANVHPRRTGIKISSGPKASLIVLTVSVILRLVVTLASDITKVNLNNSTDPLGITSTVMEQHPLSLLVATTWKFMLLRENRSVPNSSVSLESLDSLNFILDALSCS